MRLNSIFAYLMAFVLLTSLPAYTISHPANVLNTAFQNRTYTAPLADLQAQSSPNKIFIPYVLTPAAYYVSPSGSDTNPGTQSQPWRTIAKAASKVIPGSLVYVRGGTYAEQVNLDRSGTASAPIQVQAYPGETPVIDGANVRLPTWGALFNVSGNYVQTSGFEVRNSKYIGVIIKGQYDVITSFYIHHSQQNGALISGDHGTIQNSRIWRNVMVNEYGKAGSNSTGISAARDVKDGITDYAVIRKNTVWENWGEGISSYEANQVTLDGNISHDNFTANIYISDSTNVICQRNFVYMDPSSYMHGYGSNVGIMMGDEKYTPASANIKVINNLAYGNHRNLFWWQGSKGGGMNNVVIANNTFVNGTGSGYDGGVIIGKGDHRNVQFTNNIVEQDNALTVIATVASSGITYAHNLWSKKPLAAAAGAGDVIGSPHLAQTGQPLSAQWYYLTSSSPAIDRALALPDVVTDYPGKTRGKNPDIGAVEY